MPASSLSLFAAALPLAFAAPFHQPKYWGGCGQADRPCSHLPSRPAPSWSHGPYVPHGGSSGAAMPSGTGYGTGTAPWGTGTGYPTQPTGTAPAGTGVMSILPIDVSSSSTVVYTYPIRSSSSTQDEQPPITTSPPPVPMPSEMPATTSVDNQQAADDTVKNQFSASTTWTFGASGALPAGLTAATDFISTSPLTHTFAEKNVHISDGFLVLTVPGGQAGNADISSAEVSTDFDVKYASVRTWAVLTEEPGVCNGMFMYESDSQETDIEWISDPASKSNEFANNGTRAVQYTNQDLNGNPENASSKFAKAPGDATSTVHEYRLDWFADRVDYYTDGVFQHTLDTNVPTAAGAWVWNNWADGNPNWTADPPVNDAPFKIQKIEMYYDPA